MHQCTTGSQPPELDDHFPLACNVPAAERPDCWVSYQLPQGGLGICSRCKVSPLAAPYIAARHALVHATPYCHLAIRTDLWAFGLLQFGALVRIRRPRFDCALNRTFEVIHSSPTMR